MGVENNMDLADAAATPAVGVAPAATLIYVGFWRRLAAYVLDFAILIPYGLLTKQLIYLSRPAYLANLLVEFFIGIAFEVYLVKRFGGSPGKLIMRIRIAKLDGSPVGYREAWIRYSVLFVISILSSVGLVLSLFGMSELDYAAFAALKSPIRSLEAGAPAWYQPLQIAGAIWIYSEFLMLLTNRKRRALHDFMAGTVVIQTAAKTTL